ncbi:hypothetical protein ACFU98_30480 [Streptomyces sp. NPDC057575]|uniref:hypothetical protein n=1 Tax=unclassified Streptomyces TaxID=2593676 RepID=UPI00369719FF
MTGTYPSDPRLPLHTFDETRTAVRLLLRLADDSAERQEAIDLVNEVARRLPVE